jgi:hypothetical protein
MYTQIIYWNDDETQKFNGYLIQDHHTHLTLCSSMCMAWLAHLNRSNDAHLLTGWFITPNQIATKTIRQHLEPHPAAMFFDFNVSPQLFPCLQQICLFFEHYHFFKRRLSVSESMEHAIQHTHHRLPNETIKELILFMLDITKAYEQTDRLKTLFSPTIQKYLS